MAVLAEHPDDAACAVAAEVVLGSPFVAADLRALAGALRRRHLRPRAGRPRDRGRAGGRRAPWCGRARTRSSWRSTRPTCGRSSTTPGVPGAGLPASSTRAPTRSERSRPSPPRTAGRSCSRRPGAATTARACGRSPTGPRRRPSLARRGRAGRGRGAAPARRRAGRHGGPAPLGRVGRLAGGRDRPGGRGLPGGARARDGWTPDVLEAASALGQKVAEIAGGVGVMAVELFWSGGRLLVNEVATRPHNSGHWTIEGAVTSQFENHVRAVLDLPLGSTAPQHPQVASVNVFGGAAGADPARAARPRPRRRGRPRPPLWQERPAGTQTGPRDGVRRRRRGGAVPGLVGRPRPRHAGARRHRAAGGGARGERGRHRWSPSSWAARRTCP